MGLIRLFTDSFQVISIYQYAVIILTYAAVIMGVPSLMFHRRLRGKGLTERFLFCMVAGNLYLISMILLLGTLHITNRFLTLFAVFAPPVWRYLVTSGKDYRAALRRQLSVWDRIIKRQYGFRYYLRIYILTPLRKRAGRICRALWNHLRRHAFEWLLFAVITGFNIWYFSYQTFHYYGYGASDTVVHLQWVELLAEGKLFAAGVYPHGFHCIVYLLYQITRLDLFVLMRFFGGIQSVYIVMMIYVFTKNLCRSRYAPFIAYTGFSCAQVFHTETMMRFQMTIPQEYGMLFLFPMLIYLTRFLKARKTENPVKHKKGFRGRLRSGLLRLKSIVWRVPGVTVFTTPSTVPLFLAAASFSLTLSVHFYISICAAVMIIAFAIVYFPVIVRRKYFMRLLCAVMAAVFVAAAPMAFAVATGKKLEGSLRWAMSIINIGSSATGGLLEEGKTEDDTAAVTTAAETKAAETTKAADSSADDTAAAAQTAKKQSRSIKDILAECYKRFVPIVVSATWFKLICACIALILLCSFIRLIFRRDRYYDCDWIVVCLYVVLMFFVFNASTIGIPELMDKIRARVLCAYAITILFAYPMEVVVRSLLGIFRRFRTMIRLTNIVSALLCAALLFSIYHFDAIKRPSYFYYLQHNGAISCLYDIVDQYPQNRWTIVSPVDETRMVWNHGYHYELIDFLLDQENWNSSKQLTIPTQYVFFFIEKRVLSYSAVQKANEPLSSRLKVISEDYASKSLVKYASKSESYHDKDRAILMSRMYYWAQEYKKLFPDELELYYEDDEFICYRIEQNVYHLNNFAINYGYNVKNNKK